MSPDWYYYAELEALEDLAHARDVSFEEAEVLLRAMQKIEPNYVEARYWEKDYE